MTTAAGDQRHGLEQQIGSRRESLEAMMDFGQIHVQSLAYGGRSHRCAGAEKEDLLHGRTQLSVSAQSSAEIQTPVCRGVSDFV